VKLDSLPGEKFLGSFRGGKVEARTIKQWFFKRAMTIGTWYITNRRLVFEGEKPNPLFTLKMQKLPPEIYPLKDIVELNIVPWMKIEEALEVKMRNGKTVLIKLQGQTREKLEDFKKFIERAKES